MSAFNHRSAGEPTSTQTFDEASVSGPEPRFGPIRTDAIAPSAQPPAVAPPAVEPLVAEPLDAEPPVAEPPSDLAPPAAVQSSRRHLDSAVSNYVPRRAGGTPATPAAPPSAAGLQPAGAQPPAALQPAAYAGTPPPAPAAEQPSYEAPTPTPRPESLLAPARSPLVDLLAETGWQGWLRRATGGLIKPAPSAAELAARRSELEIRRTFSKPMTIVVVQPKGGAGKTPTTIGLAAALGVHRGGYVVGWDNNETRGTLAVRVANADSQTTTVWDLLRDLPTFERTDARVGDLSHYVRGQGPAQFDALVSDDSPGNMAQIGAGEFERIHAVLQRFYRQIVIDTGNNVRSTNWQAAVNAADLVIVVSTYQRDVGYSGSWVLDHLTETGRGHLVSSAITVLTAADQRTDPTVRRELLEHFRARTGAVVEIPYDPIIALGGPMEWTQLQPATRRAWTDAGAAVVAALAERDERARQADS